MATLTELFAELRAREKRLATSESGGWRDCLPSDRENVREMRDALVDKLLDPANEERLLALAGNLDLGPLRHGVSIAFSRSQE